MNERRKVSVGDTLLSTEQETQLVGTDQTIRLIQTLVYLGQDGACFHLGYRERSELKVREKFNENAVYQNPAPGQSTEITYRQARLKVYEVSNAEIYFEVLSGNERI